MLKTTLITIIFSLSIITNNIMAAEPKIKVLIVDGQNNASHKWAETSPFMKKKLEETGLFTVDRATSPPKKYEEKKKNKDEENENKKKKTKGKKPKQIKTPFTQDEFDPEFSKYDVLIMNYNGVDWSEETQKSLEDYMRSGGGMVVVHAANNSFANWNAFNEMTGLGGWGKRNEKSGPMVKYRDGKIVYDDSRGRAGTHGPQREYQAITIKPDHPIMSGLPEKWMHAKDELYADLRGPAKNLEVLSVGKSAKTEEFEPLLFTVKYGKGRIFHTVFGHAVNSGMKCVGFIFTLQRGTQWAATGKVTLNKVPKDFPKENRSSVR